MSDLEWLSLSTTEWLICFMIYIISAVCVAIYFKKADNRKHEVDVLVPIFTPLLNTLLVVLALLYIFLDGVFYLLEKIPFISKFIDWLDQKDDNE